jgi:Matrixin
MQWQKLVAFAAIANILSAGTLHLKTGRIQTPADVTDYQADAAKRFRANRSHYLLQFRKSVSQEEIDLLAARGAMVTASIPDFAVVVVAGDDFSAEGLDLEFAGRLRPEQKMSGLRAKAYVVEFHADVSATDARELLVEQGLKVVDHPDLQKNHFLVTGPMDGLKDWDEVAYIFPASRDLMAGRRLYACAEMTSVNGAMPMFVKAAEGWPTDGLNGATINYVFGELTPKVPQATVIEEITRALMQWPKHGNVHFVPGTDISAARTVGIHFASFDHGDGYPFDGPGGILAHTFYPVPGNPEPIAGDMHLDASEDWHSGANVDLYTVVLHEAGHALGLGHTDQPGAIMYPYYRMGMQISNDDIAGIEALYGPPNGNATVAPATPTSISLTIQNPAGGRAETTASTVALSGIVSNAVGATTVSWQTDHGTSGVANGSATWQIAAVPLAAGSNTVTVSAVDGTHQTASQVAVVTRTTAVVTPPPSPGVTDTIAPTITLTSPNRTIVQTSLATITVSGVASDNVGVTKVTWQNALSGSGTATGTTNWSAQAIPLFIGNNPLIFKAWDAAGNSSWRSVTVVRN